MSLYAVKEFTANGRYEARRVYKSGFLARLRAEVTAMSWRRQSNDYVPHVIVRKYGL